ncbi:MAG: translation initiation factor IF-1 [Candidatus Pacebacteria bacterium]|jgi:translation initiation factor IF-1|nr:translation initiation factor IF-1 [Candidatus Paceibacterota bacterium]
MKKDQNVIKAVVEEALPGLKFRAKTEDGRDLLVHLAGKLRINRIRIIPGDKILVEQTPYDIDKGRIIRRL